ncbi:MAG: NAD-dependent epimerase/dehydratase family protein [Bacteroidia bacterium]|nr:NAD-dependent epimerase/dehydratase family protein [Bacteroidia bacterium]
MHSSKNILVIGALGQIGQDLVAALREKHGADKIIASDIRLPEDTGNGPFVKLDVLDSNQLREAIQSYEIAEVYHLAAILSAKGEQNPQLAWDINMKGLLNVLDLAKVGLFNKLFWPSSIAVFGPNSPKDQTPQYAGTDPTTIYGISKLAGERWCEYYHQKYGVDVRSIRYPGLIGYKGMPGGGTTDYAVDIYHSAVQGMDYSCFLNEASYLPMMYMEDAIRATIELMEADPNRLSIRSSYNLGGISFSPREIFQSIKEHFEGFEISFSPDFRQGIADSWPRSIDDSYARKDWDWNPTYDLKKMTEEMLNHLQEKYKVKVPSN